MLNNESVYYASFDVIMPTLEYDFEKEKKFIYKGLNSTEIMQNVAKFISGIWQIHAFGEGNTRTTAVFAIKYLRFLGFDVKSDLFMEHSWYFRNALVRANYSNYPKDIYATNEFLYKFFGNLLLGENNILKNRDLLVKKTPNKYETPKIKTKDKILSLIREDSSMSAVQMAKRLDLSVETIRDNLKKLKSEGIITRQGSNKTGNWKIL